MASLAANRANWGAEPGLATGTTTTSPSLRGRSWLPSTRGAQRRAAHEETTTVTR